MPRLVNTVLPPTASCECSTDSRKNRAGADVGQYQIRPRELQTGDNRGGVTGDIAVGQTYELTAAGRARC